MKVLRSVLLLVSLAVLPIGFGADSDLSVGLSDRATEPPANLVLAQASNTNAPTVASLNPPSGQVVRRLTQAEVLFDRPVAGVDAEDLLVNGQPAMRVSGVAAGPYVFEFSAPSLGLVIFKWASGHGIVDAITEEHPFTGLGWTFTVNPELPAEDVIINEFLAENVSGLKDEEGDTEGWIELLNRGGNAVNLRGWSITDDSAQPGKWVFPDYIVAPGRYLVVFASGKDRKPVIPGPTAPLHTNFKLGSFGEYLGLYNAESPRQPVSEIAPRFPEQRPDRSFGQVSGGDWRYFETPTPGALNRSSAITNVLAPVHFSVNRGFFQQPFTLSLASETQGATIVYTLDGSVPAGTNGLVYSEPIGITASRIIRAAAFKTNSLPSRVVTHTYLVGLPLNRRLLPALSLVTSSNNLYGKTGIMEYNPRNTTKHGIAWERPVSAEFIRPEDNEGFHVDCGLRVQGGGYIRERYNYRLGPPEGKYSFRLYFRGDYGPGRLEFPLFPECVVQSFDTVSLRAGMNDPTNPYLRDEMARRLESDVGQVASHGTFVNLFLNGVYKGYYNPAERIDSDFLRSWYGGENKWDLIAMSSEVRDGDILAWDALRNYASTHSMTNQASYLEMERRMDLTNFVEYLLPLIYANTDDWPHNNWRAARERTPAGRFRMYCWDAEWSFGYTGSPSFNTIANQLSTTTPPWGTSEIAVLFNRLKVSPEFHMLFADRIHKHFFNGGALTDARIKARYDGLKAMLAGTISGFNDTIGTSWIPQRRRYLTNHFALAGFLASSNAPVFNLFGGRVPRGFSLTMSAGPGTIYYTTNGSDPRVRFSGAVAPDARVYARGSSLPLDQSLLIRARTQWSTNWSAVTEAPFSVEEFALPLRITEIMYNPPGGDAYEFIELQNVGLVTLDLSGISLSGVEFRFSQGATLAPGARAVLISDANPSAFARRYPGVTVAGQYKGGLSNGGEAIALIDQQNRTIASVRYQDSGLWPGSADGGGFSLEIINPNGDPSDPCNWRASASPGGSPGEANPVPPPPPIRLNEILAASASDSTGGGTNSDWVELHNPGGANISLAGWSLTDDANSRKFVFPANTVLPACDYLVVWCDRWSDAPGLHAGFALDAHGQSVLLYDAQTNRVDAVTFGLQIPDYSVGRVGPDGADWQLTLPTPGRVNQTATLASTTNLVINEFLANASPGGEDWIELYNRNATLPVALRGVSFGATNALFQLTSLSFVAPGGFALLLADEKPGPNHLDFKLPAACGFIALYDVQSAEIDRLTYTNQNEGVSLGRLPDGAGRPTIFPNSASPGASNYVAAYTGAVLNEVLVRNESAVTNVLGSYLQVVGWIELYNRNSAPFDLSGMSLSIDAAKAGQWVFPPGSAVQARSYLMIWCDESLPASAEFGANPNLGRSLPASGGGIYLFDRSGQQVDQIEFGFQLRDRSIGRTGSVWQLLATPTPGATNASPAALGDLAGVRVNEWLANSSQDDWLELYNPSVLPVNLERCSVTDDPSIAGQTNHVIKPLTFVPARGCVKWIADGQPSKGPNHLRFSLNALGETVRLYGPGPNILDSVDFLPQLPNISEGRFPDGSTNIIRFPTTPSSGGPNYLPLPNVVISEILSHAQPPLEQAVELFNPTPDLIAIGGWYLSDTPDVPEKFRIPDGATLSPDGYTVFYQYQFSAADGGLPGFSLIPMRGGEVILSATDANGNLTGYRAVAAFGPAEVGVSAGRYQTTVGPDFTSLSQPSFGAEDPHDVSGFRAGEGALNAYPKVGPVVINEIMYHPASLSGTNWVENTDEEFIELRNVTSSEVALSEGESAANRWRLAGDVDFEFAPGERMRALSRLVVVGFSPDLNPKTLAAFRAKYHLDASVRIVGPYQGKLANDAGTLTLLKPIHPTQSSPTSFYRGPWLSYAIVDQVQHSDHAPWPAGADGTGMSLQRIAPAAYGNDPANWKAALPTPGTENFADDLSDRDADGLPDVWEEANGLDPNVADGDNGANGDPDHDGLTNWQEYLGQTDPKAVTIRISRLSIISGTLRVAFNGAAGRSYSIECRESLTQGEWKPLRTIDALLETAVVEAALDLPDGVDARYFRVKLTP